MAAAVRVAVVGHVEWVWFACVPHVPAAGEIVHSTRNWEAAAGGGGVAAVQLAKLAGSASFFTALGDDERGRCSAAQLTEQGVDLHCGRREAPTRGALTHLDDAGERTITVAGERIVPHGSDPLPWSELDGIDAVYFTGGDAAALRAARSARVLVATPRARAVLAEAGVRLDALVRSASDPGEAIAPHEIDPPPKLVVSTVGARGGEWHGAEGRTGSFAAAKLPGPVADSYGCGDSFAAGLTYALGAGLQIEAALDLAARCGAACMTGRGPYESQLTRDDLESPAG
jgi:ribokinase